MSNSLTEQAEGCMQELASLSAMYTKNRPLQFDVKAYPANPKKEQASIDALASIGIVINDQLRAFWLEVSMINTSWSYYEEKENALWAIGSRWGIIKIKSLYGVNRLHFESWEGEPIPDDQLSFVGRLIRDEKYLLVGEEGEGKTYILAKTIADGYQLFLTFEGAQNVYPLSVDLPAFAKLLVEVKGISEFPYYLTTAFPEELADFPYDGFFEKVKYLFPNADLSAFNDFGFPGIKESVVDLYGKYNYQSRLRTAFETLPEGAFYQRWYPSENVILDPGFLESIRLEQLKSGNRMSLPLEAFYQAVEKFQIAWGMDEVLIANFEMFRIYTLMNKNHAPEYYRVNEDDAPELLNHYVLYTDPYNDILVRFEGEGICTFHLLYIEEDGYTPHFITDDFDELLQQLMNTRGLFWWNYFLVFKPTAGDARYSTFYNNMRNYFPDADMSRYPDPASL